MSQRKTSVPQTGTVGQAIAEQTFQEALRLLAQGKLGAAESLLIPLSSRSDSRPRALQLLSAIANTLGRHDEALHHAETALRLRPDADAEFARGRALKSLGRIQDATEAYRAALALREDFPEVWVSLGVAQRAQGDLEGAIASCRRALELRPRFPPALGNLGNALAEYQAKQVRSQVTRQDWLEAERVQREALALAPNNLDMAHNLAVTLCHTGRQDEALAMFDNILKEAPERQNTQLQMTALLGRQGRLADVCYLASRWLERHPDDVDMLLNIGLAQIQLGESEAARQTFEKVLDLEPNSAQAQLGMGLALGKTLDAQFEAEASIAALKRAIDVRPDYYDAHCALAMMHCYVEQDPQKLLEVHTEFGAFLEEQISAQTSADSNKSRRASNLRRTGAISSGGPLRVGLLSYDFKRHSVAYFVENLFEHHDRASTALVGYQVNELSDEVTQRLKSCASDWIECGSWADEDVVERITQDELDVLVDLSGLTSGSRLGVIARRPAPIQITYLGYPATTGLRAFDYRITDARIDPEGEDHFSVENLLRLPGGMFCYRPDLAPPVVLPPAVDTGVVTFGSFNNLSKVSRRTLELWAEVLSRVPRSRLLLKGRAVVQRGNREFLTQFLDGKGIDASRVEFLDYRDAPSAHLDAYGEVDIALDTFPYAGATTTCEALWMGVPVVSLFGRTQPSRMGRSVLHAAGMSDLVCDTPSDYVEKAVALSIRVDDLTERRLAQRDRLLTSRLFDGPQFAADFASTLRSTRDRRVIQQVHVSEVGCAS